MCKFLLHRAGRRRRRRFQFSLLVSKSIDKVKRKFYSTFARRRRNPSSHEAPHLHKSTWAEAKTWCEKCNRCGARTRSGDEKSRERSLSWDGIELKRVVSSVATVARGRGELSVELEFIFGARIVRDFISEGAAVDMSREISSHSNENQKIHKAPTLETATETML